MKKKFIIAVLVASCLTLGGCGNKNLFDTVYNYDYAIIQLPNGEIIEGKVEKWTDYEDGDQLQIIIDGVIYLVHSNNVSLMKK